MQYQPKDLKLTARAIQTAYTISSTEPGSPPLVTIIPPSPEGSEIDSQSDSDDIQSTISELPPLVTIIPPSPEGSEIDSQNDSDGIHSTSSTESESPPLVTIIPPSPRKFSTEDIGNPFDWTHRSQSFSGTGSESSASQKSSQQSTTTRSRKPVFCNPDHVPDFTKEKGKEKASPSKPFVYTPPLPDVDGSVNSNLLAPLSAARFGSTPNLNANHYPEWFAGRQHRVSPAPSALQVPPRYSKTGPANMKVIMADHFQSVDGTTNGSSDSDSNKTTSTWQVHPPHSIVPSMRPLPVPPVPPRQRSHYQNSRILADSLPNNHQVLTHPQGLSSFATVNPLPHRTERNEAMWAAHPADKQAWQDVQIKAHQRNPGSKDALSDSEDQEYDSADSEESNGEGQDCRGSLMPHNGNENQIRVTFGSISIDVRRTQREPGLTERPFHNGHYAPSYGPHTGYHHSSHLHLDTASRDRFTPAYGTSTTHMNNVGNDNSVQIFITASSEWFDRFGQTYAY